MILSREEKHRCPKGREASVQKCATLKHIFQEEDNKSSLLHRDSPPEMGQTSLGSNLLGISLFYAKDDPNFYWIAAD